MNKQAIVEAVRNFSATHGIPVDKFVLGLDAAAVMHGFKEEVTEVYVDTDPDTGSYVWHLDGGTNHRSSEGTNGEFTRLDGLAIHTWIMDGCGAELIDGVFVVSKQRLIDQLAWRGLQTKCPAQKKADTELLVQLTDNSPFVQIMVNHMSI